MLGVLSLFSNSLYGRQAKKEEELRVLERMMRAGAPTASVQPSFMVPTPRCLPACLPSNPQNKEKNSNKEKNALLTRSVPRQSISQGLSPGTSPGGAVNQFISTGIEEQQIEEASPLTNRSGPLSAIGSKNQTTTARSRFPIIAGPGERQRFITTFLDGRLQHEMITVEKASVMAQELGDVKSPPY